MFKILTITLMCLLTVSGAYASGLQAVTLVDVQGQSDTGLLVGASDEQAAKYYPDGKMPSQILAFWVNGVLYDAGLRDGHIVSELAENGIAASEVSTILITHLHPDHFGGLLDSEGRASFPKADVFVSKPEYDYWVNELKNENVITALAQYRVSTFMFGDEVIPGVRAMDTSGHTPGHVSYLVEADGEKLIVAGDIMHFPEIQLPVPDVAVRYDVDPVKAVQSRKFILDYAAWKNIPIAGMHITPPGIISVKKSGTGYEKF
ncbi:MAG: MBL fold metallo-hydrolase [Synergistaceae bacterium]|nr:MBL fold metallo-hydrolase [Synergistaceae bacterium]